MRLNAASIRVFVLLIVCCLEATAFGQAKPDDKRWTVDDIKAHYTKYEYRIPMRDGKRLMTAVYVPKDTSQTYPILFRRTPYNIKPYGPDLYRDSLGPSQNFDKGGYIFVLQDVRGRWMSEGDYVNMRPHIRNKMGSEVDESSDTYDTIEWLLAHVANHNGKVGMWGISYPGFYVAAGMIDAHPALTAVSPQAPVTDWFVGDDWHHNGALFLAHMFNFLGGFDRPRPEPTKKFNPQVDRDNPDGYDFFLKLGPLNEAGAKYFKGEAAFWDAAMQHGTYDQFWQARNIRPHLKDIQPAVMSVGGWFDAENLFGALEVYKQLQKNSPRTANHLVMGPWSHGEWSRTEGLKLGDVSFNLKTAEVYRDQIEFPFFEFHLKGKGKQPLPKAWVFQTGVNQWRKFDSWPPAQAKRKSLFFHANSQLKQAPPDEQPEEPVHDEFLSDPSRPVPYLEKIAPGMAGDYMTADQRFASRRPDVLVYSTDTLTEDMTIAGPVDVQMIVSTTGTDADWIVKVIDVYPEDLPDVPGSSTRMAGYQQLVRGDVLRGKFRNSLSKPEPFKPSQATEIRFSLQDTCHTFRAGHRIMIQVQSSWFPLVDRNPQVFTDIYSAKEADFKKATHRVYRDARFPSAVTVNVLP